MSAVNVRADTAVSIETRRRSVLLVLTPKPAKDFVRSVRAITTVGRVRRHVVHVLQASAVRIRVRNQAHVNQAQSLTEALNAWLVNLEHMLIGCERLVCSALQVSHVRILPLVLWSVRTDRTVLVVEWSIALFVPLDQRVVLLISRLRLALRDHTHWRGRQSARVVLQVRRVQVDQSCQLCAKVEPTALKATDRVWTVLLDTTVRM